MTKTCRSYSLDQHLLLPPDLRQWLPESVGMPSSRKIEQATYRDVAFRVLAADQHPDHDSIAEFRKRHLGVLAALFGQMLRVCQTAGLVKLGRVALDGTKVKASASKHKAMSYARMEEAEQRLEAEVRRLLDEAERIDAAEDALYGRGRRGDELPPELARRETRLATIRAAKAALEQEAREQAARAAEEARGKLAAREQRVGRHKGAVPKVPDPEQARPAPSAQRNFTDPESRIMKDGASASFVQAYNAQAAVDHHAQLIVACGVTQDASDVRQFVPMVEQVRANTGEAPAIVPADAGFFSEANLGAPPVTGIAVYVPPDKRVEGRAAIGVCGSAGTVRPRPRCAPSWTPRRAGYARRKAIVEPVFAYIKDRRGFRRFSFRGLAKVTAEWTLICLTHNILKLRRAGLAGCPV